MAASKGLIVFFLGALLLCALVTTSTVDAKVIDYGDLRNDEGKPNHPTTPANHYTRGCNEITRCRKNIGDQVLSEASATVPRGMRHTHGAH